MKQVIHKFKAIGLLPLLTNNPAKMKKQKTDGPKTKKIPKPEEEAKEGLYLDENVLNGSDYCLPAIAFRQSLLKGLTSKKIGKYSAISIFQGAVLPVGELCSLIDPKTEKPLAEYKIDSRRAVVQGNGVIRNRPRFNSWACFFDLEIDEDILTPEIVAEHLNEAGQKIGVGDFRVGRKGIFGKYRVELTK